MDGNRATTIKFEDVDRIVEKSFEKKMIAIAICQKCGVKDAELFFRTNLNSIRDIILIRLLKGKMRLNQNNVVDVDGDDDDDDDDDLFGTKDRKRLAEKGGEKTKNQKSFRRRLTPSPPPTLMEEASQALF